MQKQGGPKGQQRENRRRYGQRLILALPVDPAWALVRLDVHFIVIDIDLGDVHFKIVGQELDRFPDGSYPGPARSLEHLLQGWQVSARSSC